MIGCISGSAMGVNYAQRTKQNTMRELQAKPYYNNQQSSYQGAHSAGFNYIPNYAATPQFIGTSTTSLGNNFGGLSSSAMNQFLFPTVTPIVSGYQPTYQGYSGSIYGPTAAPFGMSPGMSASPYPIGYPGGAFFGPQPSFLDKANHFIRKNWPGN